MNEDRKRFLKYREHEKTAMEKYLADVEKSLRSRARPLTPDTLWN